MNSNQLEVGSVYRLGGRYRTLKRIVHLDLGDPTISGGKVKTVNASTSGFEEIWSAEFFASQVIEVIKSASVVSRPPRGCDE